MSAPFTISQWRENERAEKLPMAGGLADALPARLIEDRHGGALVTIGQLSMPYASVTAARAQLQAMAKRGVVQLEEEAPCR